MKKGDSIRPLLEAGVSRAEIARRLGLSQSTVSRTAIRLGFPRKVRRKSPFNWAAIRAYYEGGHSVSECQHKFGFSNGAWDGAVTRGDVVPRIDRKRTSGQTRRAVEAMLDRGMSQAGIARELDISKGTVAYHARGLGVPVDHRFKRRYDWAAVQETYDTGLSVSECAQLFGFSKASWSQAVRRGDVLPRPRELPIEKLLVAGKKRGRENLKRRLLAAGLKENRCERCGIREWMGHPLNMQLHHINGDGLDNRLGNLELLCGNCHSQTTNYGGRNGHRRKAVVA